MNAPWSELIEVHNEQEIISILKSMEKDSRGIFPLGNGTLVGQIIPPGFRAIGLSLRPYRGIREVDVGNRTVWVRAGTTITELSESLRAERLEVPLEGFWPEERTVGGMVSANSAGRKAYLYGGIKNFLLGVRFISGSGSTYTFGSQVLKNVTGYDVAWLLAGSWGHLGVITEVCLRLLPVAPCKMAAVFRPDSPQEAWDLLERLHLLQRPWAALGWNGWEIYLEVEGTYATCTHLLKAASREAGKAETVGEGEETEIIRAKWSSSLVKPLYLYQVGPWIFWRGREIKQIRCALLGAYQWGFSEDSVQIREEVEKKGVSRIFPPTSTLSLFRALKGVFDKQGILCRGSLWEGEAVS